MILHMKHAGVPLNDTQKVSILGILEDEQAAMQTMQGSSDHTAAMQQAGALVQTARAAILTVLTEPQQKVYAAMRQGPPSGPGRPGSSSTGARGTGSSGQPSSSSLGTVSDPDDGSNIDANTGGGIRQDHSQNSGSEHSFSSL